MGGQKIILTSHLLVLAVPSPSSNIRSLRLSVRTLIAKQCETQCVQLDDTIGVCALLVVSHQPLTLRVERHYSRSTVHELHHVDVRGVL